MARLGHPILGCLVWERGRRAKRTSLCGSLRLQGSLGDNVDRLEHFQVRVASGGVGRVSADVENGLVYPTVHALLYSTFILATMAPGDVSSQSRRSQVDGRPVQLSVRKNDLVLVPAAYYSRAVL